MHSLSFLALALGFGSALGMAAPATPDARHNSLHVIFPYLHQGQWVFDDDRFGLTREPFVAGADEIMDRLAEQVKTGPDRRFRLIFSAGPLPDPHIVADLGGEWSKEGGAHYVTRSDGFRFWLCPALFHYFASAPATLYGRAEKAR